jgi:bacterioferritin-associated ferredoxin
MYICICNAVSDKAILRAIDDGAHSFDALMDELAVATACGSCESAVRHHLAERLHALGHDEMLAGVAA